MPQKEWYGNYVVKPIREGKIPHNTNYLVAKLLFSYFDLRRDTLTFDMTDGATRKLFYHFRKAIVGYNEYDSLSGLSDTWYGS